MPVVSAPPDFGGRSVNPISTREGRLCPHITTAPPPPGFSDLPTDLKYHFDLSHLARNWWKDF